MDDWEDDNTIRCVICGASDESGLCDAHKYDEQMKGPTMLSTDEIESRFGFHPATEQTRELHQSIRETFIEAAQFVNDVVPDGRELALALTALQEAAMWANAGIACNLAPLKLGE